MLAQRIDREAKEGERATVRLGSSSRKALLTLIAKRRRKLRKRALGEGGRLYSTKPKKLIRRVRGAQRANDGAGQLRRLFS